MHAREIEILLNRGLSYIASHQVRYKVWGIISPATALILRSVPILGQSMSNLITITRTENELKTFKRTKANAPGFPKQNTNLR
jgi:hypothetical protein